jgi:ABC-type nickel/cobalt efflux system permease component RcnA
VLQGRVLATVGGVLLGLLLGLRHAFEPDHLTAVSTLVAEARGARRSMWLGAVWGLGHTISLVVLGTVLLASGAMLSERTVAMLELIVAVMLVVLGVRSLVVALREGSRGPTHDHRHGEDTHTHAAPPEHLHVAGRSLALRPLVVGLVHGLAGSGALSALVFAELPTLGAQVTYIGLFGMGSIAGMAIASGVVGASLQRAAATPARRRIIMMASGGLSVVLGIAWGLPQLTVL